MTPTGITRQICNAGNPQQFKQSNHLCRRKTFSIDIRCLRWHSQTSADNIIHASGKNPTIETIHTITGTFKMMLREFLDVPEPDQHSIDDEDGTDRYIKSEGDDLSAFALLV